MYSLVPMPCYVHIQQYLIAGILFGGENFPGFLARTAYCPPSLLTIPEKTSADRYKTAKFAIVFSFESFPLYGITL